MKKIFCFLSFCVIVAYSSNAQQTNPKPLINEDLLSKFTFRNIGPALMSGRIADIAIHPTEPNTWIVAVGSGGVWKTTNAGITWTPVFDDQPSYSIGCVSFAEANPNVVWVGTGENVGGRHVGYGDGVYKSEDGGKSWVNMGLKQSEHISKIVIHPKNPNTIWVAAQGPLWKSGGERGVFKSTNGGKTWSQTLGDKEWIGATDIVIDQNDATILYAATWQRHRTIASYLGGGPGSNIYKSVDGGDTWAKISNGLPTSNIGKIGLAISPQNSNVVYAALELDRRSGGFYKSTDAGANWVKQSDAVSGATGPHYYQEIYACPHVHDRIYMMDSRVQISNDGGKTFSRMKEDSKHGDNHALAFRKDDPNYLLIGTDGGVYESFDLAQNWRFMANLPLTQFYKIAVDDASPFYNVYGGTQDNSTQGGPTRTDNLQGIQNSDWRVVLDWDGHGPATEPGNPNIVYGQRQEGTLSRIDMANGEVVDIQPSSGEGESFERFNWDAPIHVSPHRPTTIYFASQRLWKSENRGDTWTAISGDLTKNQVRLSLPIMGKTQSYDNAWDLNAMSNYNTITSIAESPKQQDLIYIGTDDGLIQITEDGGKTWRKMEVSAISGIPGTSYINDIKADLHDANIAYMALDNHKVGDFTPYLYVTKDKGKTWTSIRNNLPDRTLVWRIAQDHVKSSLIFLGTEFGIYVTLNGGASWSKMKGGVPTIPFRDLAIQRRENDLVGASFGRSIYVLDDYSPLRSIEDKELEKEAKLFAIKDAQWYIPRSKLGFEPGRGDQGAAFFMADNPKFGANITYHLKDDYKTAKEKRQDAEAVAKKDGKVVAFAGWESIANEEKEIPTKIWLEITNDKNEVVRRIDVPAKKGLQTANWDLRQANIGEQQGFLVAPGAYKATIMKSQNGAISAISETQNIQVSPIMKGSISPANYDKTVAFWRELEKTAKDAITVNNDQTKLEKMANEINSALVNLPVNVSQQMIASQKLTADLRQLNIAINGLKGKNEMGEKNDPTIGSRLFNISRVVGNSTYGPTTTAKKDFEIVNKMISSYKSSHEGIEKSLLSIAEFILKNGGPKISK